MCTEIKIRQLLERKEAFIRKAAEMEKELDDFEIQDVIYEKILDEQMTDFENIFEGLKHIKRCDELLEKHYDVKIKLQQARTHILGLTGKAREEIHTKLLEETTRIDQEIEKLRNQSRITH